MTKSLVQTNTSVGYTRWLELRRERQEEHFSFGVLLRSGKVLECPALKRMSYKVLRGSLGKICEQ